MKKFKFPLQAVHNLREMRRDRAELDLAQASAEVSKAAAQVEEVLRMRENAMEAYRTSLSSPNPDLNEITLRNNYFRTLDKFEQEARARLSEKERVREERRRAAARAACEAEATANLRERHRARHAAEAALAEQNNLDEMATLAVARRQLEERYDSHNDNILT